MKYAKIINNVVTQIQPNIENGFIEVSNTIVCGMMQTDIGFEAPKNILTPEQIKEENIQQTQKTLDSLTTNYPKFEIDTFWIQELEARV